MTRILTGEYRQTLPDQPPAPFLSGRAVFGDSYEVIDFMIDTGAEITVLSLRDAVHLFGFQGYRLLPRMYPAADVSGVGQGEAVEVPMTLVFQVPEERPFVFQQHVLVMALPPELAQSALTRSLPSLLGRDILNHFILLLNPATETVELTELEPASAE